MARKPTDAGLGGAFDVVGARAKRVGLRHHLARWRKTRDPAHISRVILVCDEPGELPPEAWAYVRQEAQGAAAPGKDTRKGKRGPRPRDPGPKDLNDVKLVLLFGHEIMKPGRTVDEALVAVLDRLPQKFADALRRKLPERSGGKHDTSKLEKKIAEAAGLRAVPPTADAWRKELRALPLFPFLPFARQIIKLRATMFRETPV